ncbi:MAG: elongation factor EF-2 [Candidatus Bathyarchaeota archaeon]|nr:elongation factor EF-2 [Candidatus Bathyarchaeota archaeon]MCX8177639.1 elongation factor EF-2 [Candidatus Bathyarchaeota archaeon]MDW8193895.1 elongation factor EF-2 [Nitrososphaerota archaeon]
MLRFKQTAEILKLMGEKKRIRNVGIIAHIDHGKTTVTDMLLADAGLISPEIAGKARVLDYLEEEQKRGITIKTANISLLHEADGHPYIINLVDTPGHVDFTGKVTRALRAVDGAVVVVDAVEEIMAQTETVTRQALEERVRPVLFINKVDRLISELKLTPGEVQNKLNRIIRDFNNIIEIYGEPEFKESWKVNPQNESVAFGSALHKWGLTLKIAMEEGVRFTDIIEAYNEGRPQDLEKSIPLSRAILGMIVKNLPDPIEAQRYRLPKIWKGKLNSEVGNALLKCDDNGPTVMCITAAHVDHQAGLIATGRIFSGSVEEGEEVYLMNAEKIHRIHRVFIYMGAKMENVNRISAGNIAAISGLESARSGETIVDPSYRNMMPPFERVRYISEPVVTVAVEPKNPMEMPRLMEAVNRICIEDPNLLAFVNEETGEYLLSGMGELHLEISLKFLREYAGNMEIISSEPMVIYREGISAKSTPVTIESPDGQNIFTIQVEPLNEKLIELIDKGELTEMIKMEESGNIIAIDKYGNILIDTTGKIQAAHEIMDSVKSGFHWACRAGPLCEESMRGVKVKIMKTLLSEDAAQRGTTQITPTIRRAVWAAFLTAKPTLLEPTYRINVSVPVQWMGECLNVIAKRRGKIVSSEVRGILAVISGYMPVAESFGLTSEIRSATSGRAFLQCTFHHWERMPESMAAERIMHIRARKGLPPEIPKPEGLLGKA